MLRLVSALAFLGFALSLVVHGATYAGGNLSEKFPWVWMLHILPFLLIIPIIFILRAREVEDGDVLKNFFAPMPQWAKYAVYVLLAYVFINFFLFLYLMEGGSLDIRQGKYVLHSHGKIIHELTAEEYKIHEAYVLRGFSGHWLWFYFISGMFYLSLARNEEKESEN